MSFVLSHPTLIMNLFNTLIELADLEILTLCYEEIIALIFVNVIRSTFQSMVAILELACRPITMWLFYNCYSMLFYFSSELESFLLVNIMFSCVLFLYKCSMELFIA